MNYQLGIIGGGNMAEAIVRGALQSGVLAQKDMIVADPVAARRGVFDALGVPTTDANAALIADSANMLLAVKPQTVAQIADDLHRIDGRQQCTMTIMAGISTAKLVGIIGSGARVVRIMPNTPLLVGLGMSGIARGEFATDGDVAFAVELFAGAGLAEVVDEAMIDAVTAVSGSGPAYVFYLAEAMAEAGESLGMTAEQADQFARQTVLGAATLLRDSPEAAAELRRRVTSPGGTTQAAIEHMEQGNVRQLIVEAIHRAQQRSRELGG